MNVGLFFGSFNPIHVGHLIIANHMVEHTDMDQLWMVVSPQNPFKKKSTLAKERDRLHLVNLAIEGNDKIYASDIEFYLPRPSYTIDTLAYLKEKYPAKVFSLIMGGDNLGTLHKWKNYLEILKRHHIYVYRRPEYESGELVNHTSVTIVDAPMLDISASHIRSMIINKKSIRYMVTNEVYEYIQDTRMYDKLLIQS